MVMLQETVDQQKVRLSEVPSWLWWFENDACNEADTLLKLYRYAYMSVWSTSNWGVESGMYVIYLQDNIPALDNYLSAIGVPKGMVVLFVTEETKNMIVEYYNTMNLDAYERDN